MKCGVGIALAQQRFPSSLCVTTVRGDPVQNPTAASAGGSRSFERMRETLPVSMCSRASRAGSPKGLFRLVASRRGRSPIRSLKKLDPSRTAFSMMFDSFVLALQTRDDVAAFGVELRPPAIVIVTGIEDIGRHGANRHVLGGRDVVDVRSTQRGVKRAIGVGVVNDMTLHGIGVLRERRPVARQRAQTKSGRIDNMQRLAQFLAQAGHSLRCEPRKNPVNTSAQRRLFASDKVKRDTLAAPK